MSYVYEYSSYKKYLKDLIKRHQRRGIIGEVARAANCSHSYLSQVMSGKPELTADQVFGIAQHFKLDSEQSAFLVLLVLKSRASTPVLRAHFEKQLAEIANQNLKVQSAVKSTSDSQLPDDDRDLYYASLLYGAVHILTACAGTQTAQSIAQHLHHPSQEISLVLDWLIQRRLVQKKGALYIHSGKNVHLPTKAFQNRTNHLNWRLRGLETSNNVSHCHYTSIFAVSRDDQDRLKARVLEFIESQRSEISASGSEVALAFCCDFFTV